MNIKATNFYQFVKCPRKVYLYFYGDNEKKNSLSEFMKSKIEKGIEHEKKIALSLDHVEPEEELKPEQAYEKTLDFMKQGKDLIYQGWLVQDNLIGIPDLIEKTDKPSRLGSYSYQIGDIKLGLSAKKEYIMQVCFYSYLLSKIQGLMPEKAFLILGNGKRIEFKIKDQVNEFSRIFKRIKDISSGSKEPIYISSICKECIWRDYCLELAEKNKDISLISGLTRKNIEILDRFKIKDLKDASEMDIDLLSRSEEIKKDILQRYKLQAQSLLTRRSIMIKKPQFPKTKTEIFFDIEDTEEPDGGKIVYLYGILIDDKFTYLFTRDSEKETWKRFLEFFEPLDDFTIYHYSHHEKTMLDKLYKKYGGDRYTYNKIKKNMVDLMPVIKRSVVLPVYSYSIKYIAKFLGFRWSSEDASGSQSMLWYEKWLETKDKKILDILLRYNEEDCKAMKIVKDWLSSLNNSESSSHL